MVKTERVRWLVCNVVEIAKTCEYKDGDGVMQWALGHKRARKVQEGEDTGVEASLQFKKMLDCRQTRWWKW